MMTRFLSFLVISVVLVQLCLAADVDDDDNTRPDLPNVCLFQKPKFIKIELPVADKRYKLVKALKSYCDFKNTSWCGVYKQRMQSQNVLSIVNKTIYETKYDCCPGWVHVDKIPGCTRRSCAKRSCLNGVCNLTSMSCQCYEGFQGQQCQYDVNECAIYNGNCTQICRNSYGSYHCKCGPGFKLAPDKHDCVEINECLNSSSNACEHTCVNQIGGYRCECNNSYQLQADGRSCKKLFRECEEGGSCDAVLLVQENQNAFQKILKQYSISQSNTTGRRIKGPESKKEGFKCNCSSPFEICNQSDGLCYSSCKRGYWGENCTERCPTGRFGKNCRRACACENGALCSHVDGSCNCTNGWTGAFCSETCPVGQYGFNCSLKCKCENKANCTVDGKCQCSVGYRGEYCQNKCEQGFYGQNCSKKCKGCTSCDHISGTCKCRNGNNCNEDGERGPLRGDSPNQYNTF